MNTNFFTKIAERRLIISLSCILVVTVLSCLDFRQSSPTKRITNPGPHKEIKLSSPDSAYTFVFSINDFSEATYKVDYEGNEIVGKSVLGFDFSDKTGPLKNFRVERVDTTSVDSTWKPVYGEREEYPEKYNESLVVLGGEGSNYNLRVRAYDEGVAFRYEFKSDTNVIRIAREITEFALSENAIAWVTEKAQGEIRKIPVSDIKVAVERPLLVKLQDSLFIALGEAGLINYARMKFKNKEGSRGTLVSDLAGEVEGNLPFKSPWRFVMAANAPGKLLEHNYFLLNLNEPNKISDTSWIKPGKVIRETTLTTQGGIACVDFAVKHNLSFVEFDAGWYGDEYDDDSDATTITLDPKRSKGPLDLIRVINYAKSKNVGIILYVNGIALEKQLDDLLPLYKSWGVSGIKFGFVNVGSQKWTTWLHNAIHKAADYNLMIDVHDEYRPTGFSRTYPNLMTQEGIRGDEASPGNDMVLNTIFTRMIAGAADHTNCYFASRVTEKMGSHASQLAKAVCIYSPWQFLYWYDRPENSPVSSETTKESGFWAFWHNLFPSSKPQDAGGNKKVIREVLELAFFDALPTVWDDTKVLGGYPDEYAVIARRSGKDWFLGALTGNSNKKLEIPLRFLDEKTKYEAIIYSDDPKLNNRTKVKIEKKIVISSNNLKFDIKRKNGLAIQFKPLPEEVVKRVIQQR